MHYNIGIGLLHYLHTLSSDGVAPGHLIKPRGHVEPSRRKLPYGIAHECSTERSLRYSPLPCTLKIKNSCGVSRFIMYRKRQLRDFCVGIKSTLASEGAKGKYSVFGVFVALMKKPPPPFPLAELTPIPSPAFRFPPLLMGRKYRSNPGVAFT